MRKKKVPESLEELPSGLFPPERHIQITSENFIDFTFKRIKYSPDKEPTFKEITISREQWYAAIDNMFQCMDFLTAYKTFCEGPIENTLPSSLDVSLGQQYLTQILKKSICSLLNEKGLKQPQTFAEELWGNREETFNSYVSSLEANEIADCFYHNLFENEHFLLLKPVHYVTQEFLKNLRLDIILREKDAYTLHKPVRHKFQRNRVFVSDIDRQFQADLVDMQSLAEFNKGYKYLLTCIDLFSKFAWAVPLKDKFGKSVKSGLEIIFKERKPKVLQTDAGYEQNWRRELFIVFEIVQRIPIVYRLKDLQGEEIKGTYYEAELQKVVDSGFYPVENVIKQRKRGGITEYFVKFLGYPEKFNEWVTDI
ncbi:uncharacterized transposon-derived protein F54H12.3 [Trichonephila clavipes]|uniref:Uncharacterized transposon-derived protein F54H12.3 n=1 Tax=Trichonephila clavipes TaxID=2585209 RepID=A0A8X6RAF1_TRICX|nr:uncharacterized transposon-derived protein F54H12.3 [Trichonephila clavipes]